MPLTKKQHEKIMKQGKELFEIFEVYDKTREWPIRRERLDLTLSKSVIKKLKDLKEKTGKPVSRIIEEAVEGI